MDKKSKQNSQFDIDQTQSGVKHENARKDEDFYNFDFHDFRKSYVETTPEYKRFRDFFKKQKK